MVRCAVAPNAAPTAMAAWASSAGPSRSAGVLIRSRTSQVARAARVAGPRGATSLAQGRAGLNAVNW